MTNAVETPKKKVGRPPGSRNKTALQEAQRSIDSLAGVCVATLKALITNDKVYLECKDDVSYQLRGTLALKLLDKAVANEKEKEVPEQDLKTSPIAATGPMVYSRAKDTTKKDKKEVSN